MNVVHQQRSIRHTILAIVAVVFAVVTIVSGGRVLFGDADPRYIAFRPLLIVSTSRAPGSGEAAAGDGGSFCNTDVEILQGPSA